jgi:hypothetical protein
MKNIEKYLQWLLAVVVVFVVVFFLAKCNSNQTKQVENVITKVKTDVLSRQNQDSLLNAQLNTKDSILNAVILKNKQAVNLLKSKNQTLLSQYQELKNSYKKDTLKTPISDSLINVSDTIINVQQKELAIKDTIISGQDTRITLKNLQLINTTQSLNYAYTNINTLTANLEKQNTWWKRNQKWVYFGLGALIPTLYIVK